MMNCTFLTITLEQLGDIIGIATPMILLTWFYYSQKQSLSKIYYEKIDGIYAGFTDPVTDWKGEQRLNAGIIMTIRETNHKGYFKGEFDFAESYIEVDGNRVIRPKVRDGIQTFIGKLDFQIYWDRVRHPLRPKENRIYKGTLYLVDRLDFLFDEYHLETYLKAEYEITHYREMQAMKFTFKKEYPNNHLHFPKEFMLNKKINMYFEPYANVQELVFHGESLSDKA